MKAFALPALLALSVTGCALINDTGMRVFATPADAVALMHETVLSGQVLVYSDRTATLTLESGTEPRLKCTGTMRYTASKSGVATLKCSDGSEVLMPFTAIREAKGYGAARTTQGLASFTYGLDPEDAIGYLRPPAGKRVVLSTEGVPKLESL